MDEVNDHRARSTTLHQEIDTPLHRQQFGDVTITENPEHIASDVDLAEYETSFDILKRCLDLSDSPEHQAQILGSHNPYMMSGILGFAAEKSFDSVEQAHTVLSSLSAVGAGERYAVMRNVASPNLTMSLINLPAAERIIHSDAILRDELHDLGVSIPSEPMTGAEILSALELLYNQPDSEKAVYARGVFSGFPSHASTAYAAIDPYDRNSLRPVDTDIVQDIVAGRDLERYQGSIFTPQPTPSRDRTATVLDIWNTLSATPLIAGYGIDYRAIEGIQSDVTLRCQTLMEIDRHLGLSEYLASIGHQV